MSSEQTFDPENIAAEQNEKTNPAEDQQTTEHTKRNSGRTGPTSASGRATSSRNAIRHGMTAKTHLLDHEKEEDWNELLASWLTTYQNPVENSTLYTFVLKTAQAEWIRLRNQNEFDYFMLHFGGAPVCEWHEGIIKDHNLHLRYLTTAERRFQREYRMLEHHWKTHHKQAAEPPNKSTQPPAPDPEPDEPRPKVRFINNETGESMDSQGNDYPPPPGYVSKPIIPGVYGPNHPCNWRPKNERDKK